MDPRLEALLREYPGHPYKKWQGAHWRLLSLVELGLTEADDRVVGAVNRVLQWLLGPERKTPQISGRHRQHASMDGNGLLVCCRLGMQSDPRVMALATRLAHWQWPDGGWNCDRRPNVAHSSFHESLPPLRGLAAHGGFPEATARAAEFFLRHRMFRSESAGTIINPEWLKLHWPAYWHYDVLLGLRAITEAGLVRDGRCREALDHLESQRTWPRRKMASEWPALLATKGRRERRCRRLVRRGRCADDADARRAAGRWRPSRTAPAGGAIGNLTSRPHLGIVSRSNW